MTGNLLPDLPRRAWAILAGDSLSSVGSGFVLPFFIVYLHEVRGIDLDVAGLCVATIAAVGFVGGPAFGAFVDHKGARPALIVSLAVAAVGTGSIAFIHSSWQAFAAASVFGLGVSGMWPAIQSLLMSVVAPGQRTAVLSVHYATLNAGLGIGGITGGMIADVADPRSFELLYLVDMLSFLVFVVLLLALRDVGRGATDAGAEMGPGGYAAVLKDRTFVRLCLLMGLLVAIGYAQLESGYPAFATGDGGIGTGALGLSFGVNTFVIVAAQLFVLRALRGRRRTRAVVVLCTLWAACWSVTLLAGRLGGGVAAAAGFAVAMALFALGETLVAPALTGMVNDLAPEKLRGRYNAMYTLSWSLGSVVGPTAAGVALDAGLAEAFLLGLVACCGVAAVGARRLEAHLPAQANLITASSQA